MGGIDSDLAFYIDRLRRTNQVAVALPVINGDATGKIGIGTAPEQADISWQAQKAAALIGHRDLIRPNGIATIRGARKGVGQYRVVARWQGTANTRVTAPGTVIVDFDNLGLATH